MDPRWAHPFTCVIAGPTSCGKTQWVTRFVNHLESLVQPIPTRVIWSYGEWQDAYQILPPYVELVEGLPSLPKKSTKPLLLIIDDQMHDVNPDITKLFTKGSHHRNISVIYIVQNLFDKNKEHRTISLNAHYLIIFKNPRDNSQIVHLAKQMYPGEVDYVREAFTLATSQAHGYLLVDLKQCTPDTLRLRSYIFPGEVQQVYIRRN